MLRPDRRPTGTTTSAATVVVDRALAALALVALARGYSVLVEGTRWWSTVGLVAVVVMGAATAVRVLRPPLVAVVAPVVAAVVGLVLLTWVFVPQTLAAIVPTPRSVSGLATLLDRAGVVIMEEKAPVGDGAPVVLVLAVAFALLALLADLLLAWRRGALPLGALLVGVFVVPAVVVGETPSFGLFLVPATAWLVLLWRRATPDRPWSPDSLVPALVAGAGALVVAAVLPPVLPDVTAVAKPWGSPPPQVFGRGINPMLQLGQNLRRNSEAVALEYTTTGDAPYLSVAVLRDFTGRTWRPTRTQPGDRYESLVSLDGVETTEQTTRITIDRLKSTMLPVPYPAVQVDGLKGSWTWQRVGALLSSSSSDTRGQTYSVTSLDREPTAEQMHAIRTTLTPSLASYVELPDDLPASIARTAREVAGGEPDDYAKALALQSYFQSGEFTYSEEAPVAEDYDGNGMDVIATFLRKKAGYCVHFSSAMAVMARSLGIPARIVVGYAPGEVVSSDNGERRYRVTTDDLHAWPQLYFEGVGWVGFEPTPSVGDETRFGDDTTDTTDDGSTTPTPTPTPSSRATQEQPQDTATAQTQTAQDAPAPWRAGLGVLVALVVVLAGPAVVRAVLRRRRLRESGPVEDWWREVVASGVDVGVSSSATTTVREHAERLRARVPGHEDALARLVAGVEAQRYAPPGSPVGATAQDAREVVEALRGARTWRARLLPRSLVRR